MTNAHTPEPFQDTGDVDATHLRGRSGELLRNGCTIRYHVYGDRGAPTVVCTHGATLDRGTFDGQVTALCDAGFSVVTWDLRGHGESQPMGDRITISNAAADLSALLDELEPVPTVLVGQSFGGFVVQELMHMRPARSAAIVLIGTPALGDRLPWHQRMLQQSRPFLLRLWPEAHLRRTLPRFMSQRPDVQHYVVEATRHVTKDGLVAVTEAALEGFTCNSPLAESNVPVLVVCGEREQSMVAGLVRAWQERDVRVHLEVIEGAGHLANHEEPRAFNDVLLTFLRAHVPVR